MKSPKTAFMLAISSLVISLAALVLSVIGFKRGGDGLAEALKTNPEVLTEAIKQNPADILAALQEAAVSAREEMAKKKADEEKKQFDEYFNDPLKPKLADDRVFLGSSDAPLVLVEYSDFECPFCKRGLETVNNLREKYGDKLKFIYKHLPLSFHDNAKIAAQYFEAIALQDGKKAYRFHDLLFAEQTKLKRGEPFLQSIAKKAGADMAKLKQDLHSKEVLGRIEEDQKEAAKFGIQGTPGFLLNGIPVKGAYPAEHFNEQIVNRLVKEGKVTL